MVSSTLPELFVPLPSTPPGIRSTSNEISFCLPQLRHVKLPPSVPNEDLRLKAFRRYWVRVALPNMGVPYMVPRPPILELRIPSYREQLQKVAVSETSVRLGIVNNETWDRQYCWLLFLSDLESCVHAAKARYIEDEAMVRRAIGASWVQHVSAWHTMQKLLHAQPLVTAEPAARAVVADDEAAGRTVLDLYMARIQRYQLSESLLCDFGNQFEREVTEHGVWIRYGVALLDLVDEEAKKRTVLDSEWFRGGMGRREEWRPMLRLLHMEQEEVSRLLRDYVEGYYKVLQRVETLARSQVASEWLNWMGQVKPPAGTASIDAAVTIQKWHRGMKEEAEARQALQRKKEALEAALSFRVAGEENSHYKAVLVKEMQKLLVEHAQRTPTQTLQSDELTARQQVADLEDWEWYHKHAAWSIELNVRRENIAARERKSYNVQYEERINRKKIVTEEDRDSAW